MKKLISIFFLPSFWIILLTFALVACNDSNNRNESEPGNNTVNNPDSDAGEGNGSEFFVEDLTTLIQALEAEGADVAGVGVGDDSFFVSPEQIISVNGEQVQVYEFQGTEDVEDAAASVSGGGTIIGTTTVDWAATPHFYRSGNLIAIYAGEQEDVLSLLSATLGEPFVVGVPMVPPRSNTETE